MLNDLKEQSSLACVKKELAGFLSQSLPLEADKITALLEQPRRPEHGRLALPVFSLEKEKGLNPHAKAQLFSKKINQSLPPILKQCAALSAFINFEFKDRYIQKKLESLLSKKQLARFSSERPELWAMDFASPNAAKRMNIGHLRAAVLGQALVNLAKAFGFKVTALNHLGDWGSQFGKLLWAYKKWGGEHDFARRPFDSLAKLYVRFYKEAEGDEKSRQEARELFQKLEKGDAELKRLWRRFVRLSLENYESHWKILNVRHDLVQGESFYALAEGGSGESFLSVLKRRLIEKKLLKKSDGAEVVFWEKGQPPCLIFKTDGASTYSARDLASLIFRFERLKADKNIYIAGSDQNLHFRQIFETAGKLNPEWKAKSLHLSFGMYRFKGEGKMSTRQGQAVYLKDILDQAFKRVEKIIEERNPGLRDKKTVAREVGAGAVIFNDLMNDRAKDVDFEWSKVLDFEGNSGPFVQYSLVRSQSLLRKFKRALPQAFSGAFESLEERRLAWSLICFEDSALQSFKNFKPHILARRLLDLAKGFNRLYAAQRILGHQRERDLVLLTELARRALDRGLEILNVPRPKEM